MNILPYFASSVGLSGYFINALAYLGIAASISSISGYAGYRAGADAIIAQNSKERGLVVAVQEQAMRGAAEAIAANRPVYKTIVQKVKHEIEKNTIYRDCKHSDDQLRDINAAITGRASGQPAGGGKLPATK
jgi:hypothetical protein